VQKYLIMLFSAHFDSGSHKINENALGHQPVIR
jgi:hypothetical protein